MPKKFKNLRAHEVSTTGSGTITLGDPVIGFFAMQSGDDGEDFNYVIRDGNDVEYGVGTYTHSGTTLSRTVGESSNSDAALDLSGNATVMIGDIALVDLLTTFSTDIGTALATPSPTPAGDPDTGFYSATADTLSVVVGGVQGLTIEESGGVVTTRVRANIRTSDTELRLTQTGDTFGTTSLTLRNRNGAAGAIFENESINLIDFGFLPSGGSLRSVRLEGRGSGFSIIAANEFQIGNVADVNNINGLAAGNGYAMAVAAAAASSIALVGACIRTSGAGSGIYPRNWEARASWANNTHATRKARVQFFAYDTAAREAIRIEASGSEAMLGFLGASAVVRQNHIPDVPNAGSATAADNADAINEILAALRLYGLLKTS